MIAVEICIRCDDRDNVHRDVQAAFAGDAARIELCGQMQDDGLTPAEELIGEARAVFPRDGLLVMVRPRAGDFFYETEEVREMERQIQRAANIGADGVVMGALRKSDNRLDREVLAELVGVGKVHGLQITLHRAFDATPDPLEALDQLIDLQIDRVLTSGTPPPTPGGALEGVERLRQTIERAAGRIEVVIGGGVNPGNVAEILQPLPTARARLAVHAYSGVEVEGQVRVAEVKALVAAATSH